VRIGVELARAPDGRLLIHAVGVRGADIAWHRTSAIAPEEATAPALGAVLMGLPIRRAWPRPEIAVALGPSLVQLKRLAGLPKLTDPAQLTAAVRANAGRFFLRDGVPIATTNVRVDAPGDGWGAAAEQPTLSAVETACRAAGLKLCALVPTATVLGESGRVTDPPEAGPESSRAILWEDGGGRFAFTYAGSRLIKIRRLPRDPNGAASDSGAESQTAHAQDQLSGAYAAAVMRAPLTLAWAIERRDTRTLSNRRQIGAIAALLLAIGVATLAPGLSESVAAHTASRVLRATAAQQRVARATADSLASMNAALAAAATFSAARRPVTLTLAQLARALPEGSAMTAYRVDTAGGSLIALAPHASELVSELEHDPAITAIEIVGPVAQETIPPATGASQNPRHLERATIRFRWGQAR